MPEIHPFKIIYTITALRILLFCTMYLCNTFGYYEYAFDINECHSESLLKEKLK